MSENSQEEPKLIIDEDWKEQVQREKEMAAQGSAESGKPDNQEAAVENNPQEVNDENETPLPPATFDFLVTMLATQAMVALGQMPGASGKPEKVQKPLSKHYIDLLGTLEAKTKGNLTADEQRLLGGVLHELRMAFVQR